MIFDEHRFFFLIEMDNSVRCQRSKWRYLFTYMCPDLVFSGESYVQKLDQDHNWFFVF